MARGFHGGHWSGVHQSDAMKTAETLLRLLTEQIPPPEGKRHSLVFDRGFLVLTIPQGEVYYPVRIEPEDYERDPADIVAEIKAALYAWSKGQLPGQNKGSVQ